MHLINLWSGHNKQIEELIKRIEALEAKHPCNCICWDCEPERSDSMRKALRKSLGINQPVEA